MADVDDKALSEVEPERTGRAAASGLVEAASRDGRQSAAQAYQTYHHGYA